MNTLASLYMRYNIDDGINIDGMFMFMLGIFYKHINSRMSHNFTRPCCIITFTKLLAVIIC